MCVVNHVDLYIEFPNIQTNHIPKFRKTNETGFNLFYELFWHQNFLNASASCFRHSGNLPYIFDETLLHLQDFKLWMEFSLKNQIIVSPEVVLRYRVSPSSLSQKVNQIRDNINDSNEELFKLYLEFFENLSLKDIVNVFDPFISTFKKRSFELISKDDLIKFLLLSHNNPYIQNKILTLFGNHTFDNHVCEETLCNFIRTYFYTSNY
jgi:hypothetical protein